MLDHVVIIRLASPDSISQETAMIINDDIASTIVVLSQDTYDT